MIVPLFTNRSPLPFSETPLEAKKDTADVAPIVIVPLFVTLLLLRTAMPMLPAPLVMLPLFATVLLSKALMPVEPWPSVIVPLFVMVLLVFSPSGILGFIDRRLAARRQAAQAAPVVEAKAAS